MIFWNDFFFDEVLGTVHVLPEERERIQKVCQGSGRQSSSIMEDAPTIQETTQGAWSALKPARMVGRTTRNTLATVADGMEANCQKPDPKDKGGASS